MTQAPRVLVSGVVLGQPMGGVRRHAAELLPRVARLLREAGGALDVLEGDAPIPFPLPETVGRLRAPVPLQPPWRRWRAERRALVHAQRSARARGRPYALWHTGHLPVPSVGLPHVLTLHDLRDLERCAAPLRRVLAGPLLRSAVRRARLVVTVSETVRDQVLRRLEARRVVVVPNAADHLRVLPREPGADAPLLHVGHVEPRKNLELLLRVLALDPELPNLVLAGAPKGDEEQRLRRLAEALGVARRVTWLGPVSDERLSELYAQAAAVVLPSHLEGFGIGVLEAQRAGAPLAVSSSGALSEVAGPSVPCFPPSDAAGALAAIRVALRTEACELERQAAHAARFTWDASARDLLRAWCGAAGGSSRPPSAGSAP